jgi:hypothetical protein
MQGAAKKKGFFELLEENQSLRDELEFLKARLSAYEREPRAPHTEGLIRSGSGGTTTTIGLSGSGGKSLAATSTKLFAEKKKKKQERRKKRSDCTYSVN